jgi:hypothetical protein
MRDQNGIVRLYGGSRHWSKDQTPDGDYPPWICYARPREFDASLLYRNMKKAIYEPVLDREEYVVQTCMSTGWTVNYNLVFKILQFYVLRGYKLKGMDFSLIITDCNHDVSWEFEKTAAPWFWNLTPKQRHMAQYEREFVWGNTDMLVMASTAYGPGYSEEFEKSFDKLYS